MRLGQTCAECGGDGAGPRQLCSACEPLYAAAERQPLVRPAGMSIFGFMEALAGFAPGEMFPLAHAAAVATPCDCPTCKSDCALIVPCRRQILQGERS